MDFGFLAEYLQPETIGVAVALYVLGVLFKSSQKIKDWLNPFLLVGIGVVLCIAIYVIQAPGPEAIVQGFIQGIFATGSAVLVNQLWKQGKKEE